MKEVTTVRVDPDLKKKAEAAGLSLGQVLHDALEKALKEKKCPTCGLAIREQARKVVKVKRKDS
jgi:hypothetical protein